MTGWRFWRNVRGRLLLIVLIALAVALAASTYGFNVLFVRSTSQSAELLLRARANSELGLLRIEGGRLVAAETTDDALGDSQVWIFGPAGVVERPSGRTPLDDAAARARDLARALSRRSGDATCAFMPPRRDRGQAVGTLVTGTSLAPYEQAERRALLGSLALALVMLALVGGAVWWLLKAALRPVVQMTEQAAAWSDHDLDRRFDRGEPHDELTRLAANLDGMLDRIAASLRHERRFSAELSHELRTPLARVIAEVELALRRERDAAEYRATLEAVLRNARSSSRESSRRSSPPPSTRRSRPGHGRCLRGRHRGGRAASVRSPANARLPLSAEAPPAPLRLGVDGDLAERVLHPVVENACRYGPSWARVSVTRKGSTILYVVEDDGPGVAEQELETIFEPGAWCCRPGRVGVERCRPGARARQATRPHGVWRRRGRAGRRRPLRRHASLRLMQRCRRCDVQAAVRYPAEDCHPG